MVDRCLEKDPEPRGQLAQEAAIELDGHANEMAAQASADAALLSARRPVSAVLAGGLALVVSLVLGCALDRGGSSLEQAKQFNQEVKAERQRILTEQKTLRAERDETKRKLDLARASAPVPPGGRVLYDIPTLRKELQAYNTQMKDNVGLLKELPDLIDLNQFRPGKG